MTMNPKTKSSPVQEVRKLIEYEPPRIQINLSNIPEAWVPVIKMELNASLYVLGSKDGNMETYIRIGKITEREAMKE